MNTCTPYNVASGCAVALLCGRCGRCFIHCKCPPPELRAVNPDRLGSLLRKLSMTRRVIAGSYRRK